MHQWTESEERRDCGRRRIDIEGRDCGRRRIDIEGRDYGRRRIDIEGRDYGRRRIDIEGRDYGRQRIDIEGGRERREVARDSIELYNTTGWKEPTEWEEYSGSVTAELRAVSSRHSNTSARSVPYTATLRCALYSEQQLLGARCTLKEQLIGARCTLDSNSEVRFCTLLSNS